MPTTLSSKQGQSAASDQQAKKQEPRASEQRRKHANASHAEQKAGNQQSAEVRTTYRAHSRAKQEAKAASMQMPAALSRRQGQSAGSDHKSRKQAKQEARSSSKHAMLAALSSKQGQSSGSDQQAKRQEPPIERASGARGRSSSYQRTGDAVPSTGGRGGTSWCRCGRALHPRAPRQRTSRRVLVRVLSASACLDA